MKSLASVNFQFACQTADGTSATGMVWSCRFLGIHLNEMLAYLIKGTMAVRMPTMVCKRSLAALFDFSGSVK